MERMEPRALHAHGCAEPTPIAPRKPVAELCRLGIEHAHTPNQGVCIAHAHSQLHSQLHCRPPARIEMRASSAARRHCAHALDQHTSHAHTKGPPVTPQPTASVTSCMLPAAVKYLRLGLRASAGVAMSVRRGIRFKRANRDGKGVTFQGRVRSPTAPLVQSRQMVICLHPRAHPQALTCTHMRTHTRARALTSCRFPPGCPVRR